MSSNVEKIQKMAKGIYNRPIQIGYKSKTDVQRKEGEEWTDVNGRSWKIENGKRQQITKMPNRGLDKCKDCERLILKQRDQDTYNRFHRCYYCQINFEVDLKAADKWKDWVTEQEQDRWESIEKEVAVILKEMTEDENPFDTTVAKALANKNISETMKNTPGKEE